MYILMTEEQMLVGCIKNNATAQEELYHRFSPRMLGVCYRFAKNREDAEDMLQEGFIKVFTQLHQYRNEGALEGWIRRLVYHSMADYFRENARYLNFLVLDEHTEKHVPATGADSCYEADILDAVKTLPPASGEVFRLYAIEGFSHAEIAQSLQISEGTSKWHLSTARQKLREILTPDGRLRNELIS